MKLPVDSLGQPVPWFTYPAIEFLDSLDLSRSTIFEWGSGHSSIYFSKKCSRIESIESDPKWYQYQSARLASNQTLRLISSRSCEYSEAICSSETPCFELIIIDGHQRSLCVKQAIHKLAKGGLLILDNSDRYPMLCKSLREYSFLQFDFHGHGPINDYTWTTSFFAHLQSSSDFPCLANNRITAKIHSGAGLSQLAADDTTLFLT